MSLIPVIISQAGEEVSLEVAVQLAVEQVQETAKQALAIVGELDDITGMASGEENDGAKAYVRTMIATMSGLYRWQMRVDRYGIKECTEEDGSLSIML